MGPAAGDGGRLLNKWPTDGFEAAGVNLGGGLPCRYQDAVADIAAYGQAIRQSLDTHLGRWFAGQILIEPGRYLVGEAGLIETEVVLISRRPADDERRWVYLDIGMFNGLTETLEEAIRYRIRRRARTGHRDRWSWPARRVTAPTSSTTGPATSSHLTCESVTGSSCCRPAPTPPPTPRCGSTASSRCARSSCPLTMKRW